MGLVNTVVPLADLERETVAWCREMTALSPSLSLRLPQGQLQRGLRMASPGSSSSPTMRRCSST